jgi:hypothetical protein
MAGGRRPDRHRAGYVRVGWPCWGPGVFTLPMEWEVTGSVPSWALSGELEVYQVSRGETRLGVTMVAASEPLPPEDPDQSRVEELVEVTARSFLRRVFWTLEALSRYDLLDPGAGGMTPAGRNERGGGLDRAFAAEGPEAGGNTAVGAASGDVASHRTEGPPLVPSHRRGFRGSGRNSMVVRGTR